MSKELYEPRYNAAFDDTLNRRVLLFRKKLSELGGSVDLEVRIVRKDAINHLLSEL